MTDLEYVPLDDPILEKIRNQKFIEFVKDYGLSEFVLTSVGTLGIGPGIYYYFYKNRVKYYEKNKMVRPLLRRK